MVIEMKLIGTKVYMREYRTSSITYETQRKHHDSERSSYQQAFIQDSHFPIYVKRVIIL